jgi:hypothetical protein
MGHAMTRLPAESPLAADAGTGAPTHARAQGGGANNVALGRTPSEVSSPPAPRKSSPGSERDTLHVELAVWSGTYRIIQTRPDGRRSVWRRGIASLEEARLRCLAVADICGYEAQL